MVNVTKKNLLPDSPNTHMSRHHNKYIMCNVHDSQL